VCRVRRRSEIARLKINASTWMGSSECMPNFTQDPGPMSPEQTVFLEVLLEGIFISCYRRNANQNNNQTYVARPGILRMCDTKLHPDLSKLVKQSSMYSCWTAPVTYARSAIDLFSHVHQVLGFFECVGHASPQNKRSLWPILVWSRSRRHVVGSIKQDRCERRLCTISSVRLNAIA